MRKLKVGSLFSGIGGLDLAVEGFFGAETVWHCEIDDEPSKVLAARWPGVPNHRDVTRIDWSTVEPVDIVCGGSPCQDVSVSGPRAGMTEGTRSNLWVAMREAVAVLKPSIVIWENVRGALTAYAYSEMESEPGLLGESYGPDRPALRAAGRVVGDLSDLGYDSQWVTLPASAVGAPHRRERIFVVAHAQGFRFERPWPTRQRRHGLADSGDVALKLLPTPAAGNFNDGEDPQQWLARREVVKARLSNGNGMGMPLSIAVALLPTPRASRGASATETMYALGAERDDTGDRQGNVLGEVAWGEFEPAIRVWESLTRPAPAPTLPDGKGGKHRMAAALPEWMMGYEAGWVTDIIERAPAIKACGNGVLPQQAQAAITILWDCIEDVAA